MGAAAGRGLFERKPIEQVVAESESSGYHRALGPFDLTGIGIAAIIGSGIFVFALNAARDFAGPAIAVSVALAGVAAALSAFMYAELASMMPASGSAYTYMYAALGRFPAFLIGWSILNAYAVGNMAVAIGWSQFATTGLASLGIRIPTELTRPAPDGLLNLPAALLVIAVTLLCLPRIRESVFFNNVLVALKILIILFVIAVGFAHVEPSNYTPYAPGGWDGIVRGAAIVFFAYLGYDTVAATAEEAKNPRRDLPWGILLSVGLCGLLYIGVVSAVTGLVPAGQLSEVAPAADAFVQRGLPWAGGIVTAVAVIALATVVYAFHLALVRILRSMALDGFLPNRWARLHPSTGTPWRLTLGTGALTALGAAFLPIDAVVDMTVEASFFIYVLVAVAILVLRRLRPDVPRRVRVPWPVAAFGILLLVLIPAFGISPLFHVLFLAWLALGLILFGFLANRGRSPT